MDDFKLEKVDVTTIDSTKAYIINIEVGNMPLDQVQVLCKNVKEKLQQMGFVQFILMPCRDGKPSMTFTEIKDHPDYLFFNNDVQIKEE